MQEMLTQMMTWQTAAAMALVAFAGVVRGFSGFGSAMILAPALSALYGPTAAVPLVILLEVALSFQLLPKAITQVVGKEIFILSVAAIPTIAVGIWLLEILPERDLRLAISAAVIVFLALLLLGVKRQGPVTRLGLALSGAASGLSNGASGIGGPPVVLYYIAGNASAASLRATVICYFFVIDAVALAALGTRSLVTTELLLLGAVCLPAAVLGTWLGGHFFKAASERLYRIVAYGLIAAVAVASWFA